MGDYYEGRSRSCWGCKFFLQNQAEYRNGVCCRHAPRKIDQNLGADVLIPTITGFGVFPNVLDPETGFCGEFVPFEVAPPSTIPVQQPGTPV